MPQETLTCQLDASESGDSRGISPRSDVTQCPRRLHVVPAQQWLHTTTGRIATCPHSWMQAVHWVYGSGYYTPQRATGPRAMNHTTLAIAQELSALKECRPSVGYLARKLKVSERTVQYHLGMLREAGLLVYRSKGTRLRGQGNQASVFERVIPLAFDEALGIRTTGEGVQRRPVGASMEHRKTLGKLARKAARRVRRPRRRTSSSDQSRCTPMQGGTSGGSSAGDTRVPPESKLASGHTKSPTPKKPKRKPRKLNKVGRRYQLARQLVQQVPWLQRASIPRIAWIIRHVADAGWTALEVQAIAEQDRPILADQVRRPSGLLADRLGNLHRLYTTPERRQTAVQAWQDSRAQERARHAEANFTTPSSGPQSPEARRAMAEALATIQARQAAAAAAAVDTSDCHDIPAGTEPSLEDLDRATIAACRAEALADPTVITEALKTGMPEHTARRLYSSLLVDRALALEAIKTRNTRLLPAF